jgi:microtubule-associated protein-like 6
LITISGQDKSIMQWLHKRDRGDDVAWNVLDRGGAIDEDDEDVLGFFCLSGKEDSLDLSEFQSIIGTRPWVAAMIPPTAIPPIVMDKPKFRLEKNHIFGVQSQTTRASIRFNSNGEVIYPASRYICVYNKKKNSQIFYEGHGTDISCIGVSSDGKLAASAERSNRPNIHVWDASTCEVIIVLQVLHRRGVASIQFSRNNKFLISVGQDQDHTIALWESPSGEWSDGRLHAWNKGDTNPVLFASFYYNEDFFFVSGGRFHVKFWNVCARGLNSSYAEYSSKQKLGTMLCGATVNDNMYVSGATTGNLFVWLGRKLDRVIRAHEMGITCLWACPIGIISASKDGMIKHWSGTMDHIRSFSLTDADVPPLLSCIRSVDGAFSEDGLAVTRVLVATMSGEIYEVSAKSGTLCLLQEAHYSGEVWGLGVHPTDPDIFATAGDDKTIRIWSVSHKRIIRKAVLDCTARCVNFSPDGRLLIVGLGGSSDGKRQRKDGAFLILDAKTLKPQFEGR